MNLRKILSNKLSKERERTPTEEEEYEIFLDNFRKMYIPKQYNQIHLFDELLNEEIDHYITISDRTDGKTVNHLGFAMALAIEFDIKFLLLVRNFTVRGEIQDSLYEVMDIIQDKEKNHYFDVDKLKFFNTQQYRQVIYDMKTIGIITDLNSATNLKYSSNMLANYPLILYDEFLAIEGDYLPDEWERLKTIYESVNRKENIPFLKFPKIMYLGNPVNFNSPILSMLNLFNILENHPIDTIKQYGNIYLENLKNKNTNGRRNLRAFSSANDSMTTGQFLINKHRLASEKERTEVLKNGFVVIIKLERHYLKCFYTLNSSLIILSISGFEKNYQYNMLLKDNKENSIFLKESYFDFKQINKHNKGRFVYDNSFSKDFIMEDSQLTSLKILRIIREHKQKQMTKPERERNNEMLERNYINDSLKRIAQKFFNE